jgi:hypothetical protein
MRRRSVGASSAWRRADLMSQILRPSGDAYRNNLAAGDYTGLNEAAPGDETVTSVRTNALSSGGTAQYICDLTNPARPVGPGLCTIRYRAGYIGTRSCDMQVAVLDDFDVVVEDVVRSLPQNSYSNFEFAADLSGVTDWSKLQLSAYFAAGSGVSTTAGYLSQAEAEVPDIPPSGMMEMF